MAKAWATTKTFGGKGFRWATSARTKSEANQKAKMIRKGGHKVRVVKTNNHPFRYGIYVRYS